MEYDIDPDDPDVLPNLADRHDFRREVRVWPGNQPLDTPVALSAFHPNAMAELQAVLLEAFPAEPAIVDLFRLAETPEWNREACDALLDYYHDHLIVASLRRRKANRARLQPGAGPRSALRRTAAGYLDESKLSERERALLAVLRERGTQVWSSQSKAKIAELCNGKGWTGAEGKNVTVVIKQLERKGFVDLSPDGKHITRLVMLETP